MKNKDRNEKWLSAKLRTNFKAIKVLSFEACAIPCVPDLHCIAKGCPPFWVELKRVPSEDCLIPFRSGQPEWIDAFTAQGGVVFVMVMVAGEELWTLAGNDARILQSRKLLAAERWVKSIDKLSAVNVWEGLEKRVLAMVTAKSQAL